MKETYTFRPCISIIMSTYNGVDYIKEALLSVFSQTFSDFELIVINDCSTDTTADLLDNVQDCRLRVITNKQNKGLAASLNIGIKNARGKYIARMDDDDICVFDRLEKQYSYLESNPQIGICGGWISTFGATNKLWKTVQTDNEIRAWLFYNMPMAHPTLMIRRSLIEDHNLWYNKSYKKAEDYDFLLRASKITKFHNLQEVLLKYRVRQQTTKNRTSAENIRVLSLIRGSILKELGISPLEFLEIHTNVANGNLAGIDLDRLKKYTLILLRNDRIGKLWPQKLIENKLLKTWLKSYIINIPKSMKTSPFLKY